MADTATFSGAMRTKLLGPIRDNWHSGMVLLFGAQSSGDPADGTSSDVGNPTGFKGILSSAEGIDYVGNEFRIPWRSDRAESVGFRSENEVLPAPDSDGYTYLQEPLRFAYALFNITGQLLKASESSEGAFKSAFKAQMAGTIGASKRDFCRAAYGDSTGAMTSVVSGGGVGTATVTVGSTINFRGGEVLDWPHSSTGVIGSGNAGMRVLSVNRVTKVVTMTSNFGTSLVAGTHVPVRASLDSTSAVPNNSQFKEIQGLSSIVSNAGSLHGMNPTTYALWKSLVNNLAGTPTLNDRILRDAKDGVMFESGVDLESGLDYALITTRGVRSRYADTLLPLKRFNDVGTMKLHGGFTALMFDENPIFTDDLCPNGNLWGLALNKLFWAQQSDWEWMQEDGKVLKWESRRDRYIAVLFKYCQLGTTQRNAHFRLTGLADDNR